MQEVGAGLTFSGIARFPMLGVRFTPPDFSIRLSASPAMETGRCFRLLLMFASVSGSTLFCQQVTFARNPFPSEVTESLLCGGASEAPRGGGIDLDEAVLRISACEDEDFTDFSESRLTKLDLEEDLLVSVTLSLLEELFLIFLSPFSAAGFTCLGTELRRYGGMASFSTDLTSYEEEKFGSGRLKTELKKSKRGRKTREESLFMQKSKNETHPSFRTFRIAMKELGNVSHDRLFIRTFHVNIFWVQKSGNSKFRIGNLEMYMKILVN